MDYKTLIFLILHDQAVYEFAKFACKERMVREIDCQMEKMVKLKELIESQRGPPHNDGNVVTLSSRRRKRGTS